MAVAQRILELHGKKTEADISHENDYQDNPDPHPSNYGELSASVYDNVAFFKNAVNGKRTYYDWIPNDSISFWNVSCPSRQVSVR